MDAVVLDAGLGSAEGDVALRRVLAVFNPAAGRKRRPRFDRIVTALKDLGCIVTVMETTAPGHAESIAREVQAEKFDVIAAAGGDGTVNESSTASPKYRRSSHRAGTYSARYRQRAGR